MAEKKSKTDVTARDKSGRATNHRCDQCSAPIMNDREMVVVMDGGRRDKTYYYRDCFQELLSPAAPLHTDGQGSCPKHRNGR